MRSLGVLIVTTAAVLVYIGVDSLRRVDEMAGTLSMLAASNGEPFDASDWAWHWRLTSLLFVVLALTGIAAGTGMVRRRRWALVLWCSAITVLLAAQALTAAGGFAKYAFEETGWPDVMGTAGIVVASWIALWMTRHRTRIKTRPLDSSNRQA